MHLLLKVLPVNVITIILRLITGCYLVIIFTRASIVCGQTNTVKVMQLIEKSLPPNLKLRETGYRSVSSKRNRFGEVNHIFIYIHKCDSKEPIINGRADG